jgi:flavin-binding protein dodecin
MGEERQIIINSNRPSKLKWLWAIPIIGVPLGIYIYWKGRNKPDTSVAPTPTDQAIVAGITQAEETEDIAASATDDVYTATDALETGDWLSAYQAIIKVGVKLYNARISNLTTMMTLSQARVDAAWATFEDERADMLASGSLFGVLGMGSVDAAAKEYERICEEAEKDIAAYTKQINNLGKERDTFQEQKGAVYSRAVAAYNAALSSGLSTGKAMEAAQNVINVALDAIDSVGVPMDSIPQTAGPTLSGKLDLGIKGLSGKK